MSILYKKVWRLLNPLDKKSAKKVYPVITYKYGVAMDLKPVSYTHLDVYKRQLKNGEYEQELPAVLINGTEKQKVYQRTQALAAGKRNDAKVRISPIPQW